jgi:hypothetical protein
VYYVIAFLVGVVVGAICLFLYVSERFGRIATRERAAKAKEQVATETLNEAKLREARLAQAESEVAAGAAALEQNTNAFNRRVIAYQELQDENWVLKRDLRNIEVSINRTRLDTELSRLEQAKLNERSNELARRYLAETVKSIGAAISSNNYSACKQRLLDTIKRCRDIGFKVPQEQEEGLLSDLKLEFEQAVKLAFDREEQARIKAQIREEEQLQREIDKELKQIDRERIAIQAALDRALAEAQNRHSVEVDNLRARLADAEERARRAISMAQLTKAGYVYVISNIGSFGEGVFKVGMTRRLEPEDRIRELSSASVPFPYDIHMMIRCNDAPALENALHRSLHRLRINKANPRKEFFRLDVDEIVRVVKQNHGEVEYVAGKALEYHQSQSMSSEDQLFIEQVFETVAKEDGQALAED